DFAPAGDTSALGPTGLAAGAEVLGFGADGLGARLAAAGMCSLLEAWTRRLLELVRQLPAQLAVFARDPAQQMPVENAFAIVCGSNRASQYGVRDLSTRELGNRGKPVQLLGAHAVRRTQVRQPEGTPLLGAGQGKRQDRIEPTREGIVETAPAVAGQDGDAVVTLHALQQVVGLRVGEAIIGLVNIGALAE